MELLRAQLEKWKKYRTLLGRLVQRDLKVKYRRSVLGYLWSLLNPLLMMVVMSVGLFSMRTSFTPGQVTVLCHRVAGIL